MFENGKPPLLMVGDRDTDQVDALRAVDSLLSELRNTDIQNALSCCVLDRFREASAHRRDTGVDADMIYGMYAYKGEYAPGEVSQLEPGTHVYVPLISNKCRALQNWVADIMQNAVDRPFTLDPTPIPEVPDHLETVAVERLMQAAVTGAVDPAELQDLADQARSLALDFAMRSAKEACKRHSKKIEDQLSEGGWRDTFDQFVVDLSSMPGGIIHGPAMHRVKRVRWQGNEAVVSWDSVFRYRRVSPFDFFPAPNASSVGDAAYLIERRRLLASDIEELRSMPGYDVAAVTALLARYPDGHSTWYVDSTDQTRQDGEGLSAPREVKEYHVMVYVGRIPARLAATHGIPLEPGVDPLYGHIEVELWVCGDYVLRAIRSPYPADKRPYYLSGFQRRPGQIWFDSLPVVLRDTQRMVNASVRALAKNMAFAAGPIAEVDVDSMAADEDLTALQPYRIYKVTPDPMRQGAPVWRFTTVPSTAPQLLRVYDQFMNEADNLSGIPAFVSGQPNLMGAGRTLGGLSMLMGNAAKGVKRVIALMDNLVIQPMVELMYMINLLYSEDDTIKADAQAHARGSSGLLQRELSQSRALELLQVLVQPAVAQSGFVPASAIPKLLRDIAMGMGYDPDLIPDPEASRSIMDALAAAGIPVGSPGAAQAAGAMPMGVGPGGMAPGAPVPQMAPPGMGASGAPPATLEEAEFS